MKRALVLLAALPIAASTRAQDIFLFDSKRDGGGYTLEGGVNVTKRAGYDNQPTFTPDSRSFLYASQRSDLTDVYEYDLETRETREITDTPEMPEYSPMPNADNTHFTVVRENTSPDQTVWRVDRKTGASEWALTSREPIGYYMFNSRGEALVWIRYAFAIHLARPSRNESVFVTGHAAPSAPQLVPGTDQFTFVHRQVNGESWIKKLDPDDRSVTPVAPLLGEQIYYGWTTDGILLTARDSTLYQWTPGESHEWAEVADLSPFGLRGITRLAVSPDGTKIAIVAEDADP